MESGRLLILATLSVHLNLRHLPHTRLGEGLEVSAL